MKLAADATGVSEHLEGRAIWEGASIFKFPNDHTFTGQSTVARSLTQATRCSPCGAWTAEHETSHEAAMAFCA